MLSKLWSVMLLSVPLAIVWFFFNGASDLVDLAVGFVLGMAVNLIFAPQISEGGRPVAQLKHPLQAVYFVLYFLDLLLQVFLAGFNVAKRLLWGKLDDNIKSGAMLIPANATQEEWLISAFSAHGITITPGSLVVGYEKDNTVLLVHVLHTDDWSPAKMREEQQQRSNKIRRWLSYD